MTKFLRLLSPRMTLAVDKVFTCRAIEQNEELAILSTRAEITGSPEITLANSLAELHDKLISSTIRDATSDIGGNLSIS